MSWHRNPPVSFWPGKVPGLVRLCSSCYQCGYRARSGVGIPKLPQMVVQHSMSACPIPSATVVQCARAQELALINKTSSPFDFDSVLFVRPVPSPPPLVLINVPAPDSEKMTTLNEGHVASLKKVDSSPKTKCRKLSLSIDGCSPLKPVCDKSASVECEMRTSNEVLQLVPSSNPKAMTHNCQIDCHYPVAVSSNRIACASRPKPFANTQGASAITPSEPVSERVALDNSRSTFETTNLCLNPILHDTKAVQSSHWGKFLLPSRGSRKRDNRVLGVSTTAPFKASRNIPSPQSDEMSSRPFPSTAIPKGLGGHAFFDATLATNAPT